MQRLYVILLCVLLVSKTTAFEANFDHGIDGVETTKPRNIAHRGASGVYPEHTVEAYQEAIDQGSDVIECDVVVTKDLVLVCIHENWLSEVTNVKDVFPDCEETLYVPDYGSNITDCFVHNFTLSELRTLGMKQRFDTRDPQYDNIFGIVTLTEHLNIAKNANRTVVVYPELKNPVFVHGLDIWNDSTAGGYAKFYEDLFLETLHEAGYTEADDPCLIQCFNYESLMYMKNRTNLQLVKALGTDDAPITDEDLDRFQSNGFYGIALTKTFVVDEGGNATDLTKRVHARGMTIHAATFKNDDLDLRYEWDIYNEYAQHSQIGIDGAFVDFPATYRRSLELLYPNDGENEQFANGGPNQACLPFFYIFMMTVVFFCQF